MGDGKRDILKNMTKMIKKAAKSAIKAIITSFTPWILIMLVVICAMGGFLWVIDSGLFKEIADELRGMLEQITGSSDLASLVEIVEDGEGGYCYQFNKEYITQLEEVLKKRGITVEKLNVSGYETLETFIAAELATQLPNLNGNLGSASFTSSSSFLWPVGSSEPDANGLYTGDPVTVAITSRFGYRGNIGVKGASTDHKGLDIGAYSGTVVIATQNGTVTNIHPNTDARGYFIDIDHGNGITTRYQHLTDNSATVNIGDTVVQGQQIALSGSTGIGAAHLHFEVQENGVPVDPLNYVDPDNPRPKSSSSILENAKQLQKDLQDYGFSYKGTANWDYSFPVDLNSNNRYLSCSSFVQELLLRCGFSEFAGGERLWADKGVLDSLAGLYNWEIINPSDIQPGDICFGKTSAGVHVAVYAGDNMFYGSPEFKSAGSGQPYSSFFNTIISGYRVNGGSFSTAANVSDNEYKDAKFQGTVTIQRALGNKTVEVKEDIIEDENNDEENATTVDSLAGYTVIGDSFMVKLNNYNLLEGAYVHAEVGKSASYWLQNFNQINEESTNGVVVLLGANGATEVEEMKSLLDKIKDKYSSVPIYVLKVFPMGANYTYMDVDELNNLIKNYNDEISNYCNGKGYNFIDATDGLIDSNGYLYPSDSEGIHIEGEEQNKKFYNNIISKMTVNETKVYTISGVTGSGKNMKYLPPEEFESKIQKNSNDILGYFTMDDEHKIIVANWSSDNEQITYTKNQPIEYISKIEKYTMPLELLSAFQIYLHDEELSIDLANLGLQSVSILSIQDNTTVEYTKEEIQYYIETISNTRGVIDVEYSIGSTIESKKESNSISAQITKVDGWCAHFEREYSYVQTDTGYVSQGTVSDNPTWSTSSNNGNSGESIKIKTTKQTTTYSRTVRKTFTLGKSIITNNEEKFIKVLDLHKMSKSQLKTNPDWLLKLIESSESTKDMGDLIRYLIYKATGRNLGVTTFDFSEYMNLNQISSGGVSILSDWLATWESESVWKYRRGEIPYDDWLRKNITEDKQYYICYTDGSYNGLPTRNYGYGVTHFPGTSYTTYYHVEDYAQFGIDIKATEYNKIGESLISVDIVDKVREIEMQSAMDKIQQAASSGGITLKDYELHALVAIKYQYGNIGNFVSCYQKYGNTEELRQNFYVLNNSGQPSYYPFFKAWDNGTGAGKQRSDNNWQLFHNGIYVTKSGLILDPNNYNNDGSTGVGNVEEGYDGTITFNGKTYNQYKQSYDPWKNIPYWGGTIYSHGCGPTSLSIIASGYGLNETPQTIANYMNNRFGYTYYGALSSTISDYLNISNQVVFNTNVNEFTEHLKKGKPIVVSVYNIPDARYTGSSHIMAVIGINENNEVYVSNPNANKDNGWIKAEKLMQYIDKYYIKVDV